GQLLPKKEMPLSEGIQNGSIHPEVISVWLPLDENADENEVIAMYERLAAGFEQQNPGCGVNVRIYADDSFTETLSLLDKAEEVPVVFMDTQDAVVQAHAADISSLTAALEDVYTADLTQFDTAVPLGCSVPVLFYNAHYSSSLQTMDADTILFDSLPANTVFDISATEFVTTQDAAQKPTAQFQDFLQDGHYPVLASSSCMAQAEHSGISSGVVHMMPVVADGSVSVQYEMYCTVNQDATPNSQRVGMLWLRYLLTEEAQQILFVEHYSDLPLHKAVLPHTLENHKALQAVGSVLGISPKTEEITTTQEGGQDDAME
ncbi:MAG: hypothetical protein K2I93_05830, partial [Oscillospiraceae bacterium]|nr:hypothetical protein [Oscillospiraceae bacterium]